TVMYDCLISKYMGETANQLKLIFDAMKSERGVYFFDEFDAKGLNPSFCHLTLLNCSQQGDYGRC
ncbi:MAG: hypothetical protein RLZZ74_206, partial [Cyanobacteriota bacterium]